MTSLSEQTIQSLKAAGWNFDRRIDIQEYVAAYKKEGHDVFPVAITFLEQFGGLKLRYPHFRVKGEFDSCNFDALIAARVGPSWLHEYENHIGSKVIPIGAAFSQHTYLLMTESGAVYAVYEDLVLFVGDNYISALNALCEGHELESSELEEVENTSLPSTLYDSVKDRIRKAGWTEGRAIPITANAVMADGTSTILSPQVAAFLQEFGNLRITTEPGGEFNIDPKVASRVLKQSFYREIAERLEASALVAVGIVQPGEITVIMDEQGRMFGTMAEIPDWLIKYGDNQIAGLNAIVTGQ